ncbi:MAG: NAD(P)H-dependent oxidoreductase subunit E [Firmicutes bacterium]|nr:NAD(P)H-dependent oxidoreductase subunit E [Bacillota bacterium]
MKIKIDTSLILPIVKKYANQKGSLISILQSVQELFGYISTDAIEFIAKKTGIAIAKIEGVASFYSQFRTEPIGKYHILFCLGTACHVNSGKEIFDRLKDFLDVKDNGTTEDGLFTLSGVACIGCCSLAPAFMISGKVYGGLTSEKAIEIIRGLRDNG